MRYPAGFVSLPPVLTALPILLNFLTLSYNDVCKTIQV